MTAPALRTARMDRLETLSLSVLLCFVAALQLSVAASGVLLALTLLCWTALLVMREEQLEVPSFFWPLLAYAAVTLISTTASVDPAVSLVDSKQLVLFLIVPLVYRLARGHRAHLFASVIIAVGAASALVGLFQYGFLQFDNLGRRPHGAVSHYMTYSGALMIVACVAAARLLFAQEQQCAPAEEREGQQNARGCDRKLERRDEAEEHRQRERLESIHACSSQCRRGHVVLDILLSRPGQLVPGALAPARQPRRPRRR